MLLSQTNGRQASAASQSRQTESQPSPATPCRVTEIDSTTASCDKDLLRKWQKNKHRVVSADLTQKASKGHANPYPETALCLQDWLKNHHKPRKIVPRNRVVSAGLAKKHHKPRKTGPRNRVVSAGLAEKPSQKTQAGPEPASCLREWRS